MSDYYDAALEGSRRAAWARYYAARGDLIQLARWATEFVEHAEQELGSLPPEMAELANLIVKGVDEADRHLIRRFVKLSRRRRHGLAA